MRSATFRSPGDRDWGLPGFTDREIWREVTASISQLCHHLFTHGAEARGARRRVARQDGPVLVSIGSGRDVPVGWLGVDLKKGDRVYRCDLRKPLPFRTATVDAILAEHVMEHFPLDDIPAMLQELLRVLKPGGAVRIVCPDAAIVAGLLAGRQDERVEAQVRFDARVHRWEHDPLIELRVANRLAYQFGQHHALLTADGTALLLEASGFEQVKAIPVLTTEYFDDVPGTHFERFPDSAHEAFAVEAVRP